jgi:hypothetical protein
MPYETSYPARPAALRAAPARGTSALRAGLGCTDSCFEFVLELRCLCFARKGANRD